MHLKHKTLTIGIPTYNRPDKLAKLLTQLEKANIFQRDDLVVRIQDNSDLFIQKQNQLISERYQNCKYQANAYNLGFGGNILKLLENANSKYVLFLSDDDDIWIENLCDLLDSIHNRNDKCIHILPFTYGDDMNSITNTSSEWCSTPILAGLYQHGIPFTLFSACVFPLPVEVDAKADLIERLLPYKSNVFIQMIIPLLIQKLNELPLSINYSSLPLIKYYTDYEYRWPLLATHESLNRVYKLLHCQSLLDSTLYKSRKLNNLRSHLLSALHSKGKLRKIPKANKETIYFIQKGILSLDFKNILLALTLLFVPPHLVKAIMISRGHTNSFPS